ncbi:MAG: flavin reductase [Thermotoga sp.]|nr:MAG: flavin reductase [Thermotoga sp.]
MKEGIDLKFLKSVKKFYFHYPFPVTVVGAKHGDKINFMSAAWHAQFSFDPPLYGVLISPKRFTHDLIKKSSAFSLNFLDSSKFRIVHLMGRISGRDVDKVGELNLKVFIGKELEVPILSESYAAYECELFDEKKYGDHTLFVGKIVGIHYDEELFNEKYQPDITKIIPTLYLGSNVYPMFELREIVELEG